MSIFWVAHLETANFEFTAYGSDSENARDILRVAFEKHILNRRGWLTWDEVSGDVWLEEVNLGSVSIR